MSWLGSNLSELFGGMVGRSTRTALAIEVNRRYHESVAAFAEEILQNCCAFIL